MIQAADAVTPAEGLLIANPSWKETSTLQGTTDPPSPGGDLTGKAHTSEQRPLRWCPWCSSPGLRPGQPGTSICFWNPGLQETVHGRMGRKRWDFYFCFY